jgi:thiosulfate/3-mercaptopyruvate sulfurtransferase
MNLSQKFLSILLVALLFNACRTTDTSVSDSYTNAKLLLSANNFEAELNNSDVLIIDVRSSFEAYKTGHIPGAVYFHARRDLVDKEHPVEHFMVDADMFQDLMQSIGVNNNSRVLVYDEGNALGSARLFYGLEYYGFGGSISILDGGMAAWEAAQKPIQSIELDTLEISNNQGDFISRKQENKQCDIAYVIGVEPGSNKIIFDVRSAEEYEGTDVRAEQGGHIPGAVNLEWSVVLVDGDVPFFKSHTEIQAIYDSLGITRDKEVIPHCHTNVRGSHAYFTLRLMGYDSVRPYEGSWSEYGNAANVVVN